MFKQTMQFVPNLVTRTLICVDSVEDSDFSGRIYNPYMPQPVIFNQVMDIIVWVEAFCDDISYPQSSFEDRSFLDGKTRGGREPRKLRRYLDDEVFERETGQIATFEFQVRHRRAATWQGDFLWREGRQRGSFRSMLELLRLMHRALAQPGKRPDSANRATRPD